MEKYPFFLNCGDEIKIMVTSDVCDLGCLKAKQDTIDESWLALKDHVEKKVIQPRYRLAGLSATMWT